MIKSSFILDRGAAEIITMTNRIAIGINIRTLGHGAANLQYHPAEMLSEIMLEGHGVGSCTIKDKNRRLSFQGNIHSPAIDLKMT